MSVSEPKLETTTPRLSKKRLRQRPRTQEYPQLEVGEMGERTDGKRVYRVSPVNKKLWVNREKDKVDAEAKRKAKAEAVKKFSEMADLPPIKLAETLEDGEENNQKG